MAIATTLTEGADTSGSPTVITTASVAPSADALVLAVVALNSGGLVTSVTGNGFTWVQVDHLIRGGGRLSVWRAMGASPSAGAVEFTSDTAQLSRQWAVIQLTDVNTGGIGGSGAIVQTASAAAVADTLTADLGTVTAGNATVGFAYVGNTSTITPGSPFVELANQTVVAPGNSFAAQWDADGDPTVDASWSSANAVVFALEVAAATVADNAATVAADLPTATGALSGSSINPATVAGTLSAATGSLAGASGNPGTAAGLLAPTAANLHGASVNPATIMSGTLPEMTGSLSGDSINPAVIAGTVPHLTGGIVDQATVAGTLSATLPVTTAALAGGSANPATVTAALTAPSAFIVGGGLNAATLAANLPALTGALTAGVPLVMFMSAGAPTAVTVARTAVAETDESTATADTIQHTSTASTEEP